MTRILKLKRRPIAELIQIAVACMQAEIDREAETNRLADEEKKRLRKQEQKARHREIDRQYQQRKRDALKEAKQLQVDLSDMPKMHLAEIERRLVVARANAHARAVYYARVASGGIV